VTALHVGQPALINQPDRLLSRCADALDLLAECFLQTGAGDSSGADRCTLHLHAMVEELADAWDVSAETSFDCRPGTGWHG